MKHESEGTPFTFPSEGCSQLLTMQIVGCPQNLGRQKGLRIVHRSRGDVPDDRLPGKEGSHAAVD